MRPDQKFVKYGKISIRWVKARMSNARWKFAVYAFFGGGAIIFVSAIVFLFSPDPFINILLKDRITETFQEAYPAYSIRIGDIHYNTWENRIGFDSVVVTARDSTTSGTLASYSVSGIGWWELLKARDLVPQGFAGSVLDAHGIVVNVPQSQYTVRCESLRVSVADSELVIQGLKFHPVGDEEQFFAGSKFRKTRYHLDVPRATVAGFACLELLFGKNYRIRSAHIHDAFLDVLINKDKPFTKDTVDPSMPGDVLSSIQGILLIDSLSVMNGAVQYAERFAVGSNPAVLTLDSVHLLVEGIANRDDRDAALVIRAEGLFMKAGTMKVSMSIPVASPELTFQYSGSLSGMNLNRLNPFVDPSEQVRIKSGTLRAGSFEVNVSAGHASGSVHAVYDDLTLAAINKHTGSEKGIMDLLASFVANNMKIRTNNMPDKSGSVKNGVVNYTKKSNETFLEFSWFAVRSGLSDVVGF